MSKRSASQGPECRLRIQELPALQHTDWPVELRRDKSDSFSSSQSGQWEKRPLLMGTGQAKASLPAQLRPDAAHSLLLFPSDRVPRTKYGAARSSSTAAMSP